MMLAFDYLGWEEFQLPPDLLTWSILTLFAINSGILMVYLWNKSSVNLGPILASSFYSIFTFPMIIAIDVLFVQE